MNPTRDDLVREYLDKICGANTAHQMAAFQCLLDGIEHIGFVRGYEVSSRNYNTILEKMLIPSVPTILPRKNNASL